jgi:hypothetical protein
MPTLDEVLKQKVGAPFPSTSETTVPAPLLSQAIARLFGGEAPDVSVADYAQGLAGSTNLPFREMPTFMKAASATPRAKFGGAVEHVLPEGADELPSLVKSLGGSYTPEFRSFGSVDNRLKGMFDDMEGALTSQRGRGR